MRILMSSLKAYFINSFLMDTNLNCDLIVRGFHHTKSTYHGFHITQACYFLKNVDAVFNQKRKFFIELFKMTLRDLNTAK